ncbi:Hypothetical protein PHPALM_11963 [Phytophthora palmivora]|uniref:Uncharacterized protein n=1 Tax=Phytophthora palmivora TaxID=4796 RepID=A0A2P4Y0Z3_9STRA|nr:Hypothetical protein PHPALM_11963 [Phytophthora palmivora]
MVRVSGSVGDSGFRRESQEDVQVKVEQGDQASSDLGSTMMPLNESRSADQQSARRNSADGREGDLDPDPDLEEKPLRSPRGPRRISTCVEIRQQNKGRLIGSPVEPSPYPPKDPLISRSDKKKPKKKLTRKKMKAPEVDDEDQFGSKPRSRSGQGWSDEDLENLFYHKELREFLDQDPVMRILKLKQVGGPSEPVSAPVKTTNKLEAVKNLLRLLKEAGMTTGAFDVDDIFDLELKVIQATIQDLFSKLKILVGEIPQITDPVPSPPASITDRQTSSSHYASAAEDGSAHASEPNRMSLGPSGTSMLEARSNIQRQDPTRSSRSKTIPSSDGPITAATTSDDPSGTLQKCFEIMSRFLAAQRGSTIGQGAVKIQDPGSQDVEMESVRSEHSTSRWEYDPDDIDFPTAARATVATATTGSAGTTMIQRIRISAISDLKEFTRKHQDEDRASAWIGKVKSAFMRDQASDEEKCLIFADLPVTNGLICSELSKSSTRIGGIGSQAVLPCATPTRGIPSQLSLLSEFCWITRKDQDLGDRLVLLRLSGVDDLEEVLLARERAKADRRKPQLDLASTSGKRLIQHLQLRRNMPSPNLCPKPMDLMDLTRMGTIIGGSTRQLSRMLLQRRNLVGEGRASTNHPQVDGSSSTRSQIPDPERRIRSEPLFTLWI